MPSMRVIAQARIVTLPGQVHLPTHKGAFVRFGTDRGDWTAGDLATGTVGRVRNFTKSSCKISRRPPIFTEGKSPLAICS